MYPGVPGAFDTEVAGPKKPTPRIFFPSCPDAFSRTVRPEI